MPQVPRYSAAQVRQEAMPGVRVSADAPIEAFGGGSSRINRAANEVAQSLGSFIQDEKRKADDSVLADAQAKATEARNRMLYDPKSGAYNKRGKDAFGVVNEYGDSYVKELDQIEKGLANDDQRAKFGRIRAEQSAQLNSALQRHLFDESDKYQGQVIESSVMVSQQDAIKNYQMPGKVGGELSRQEGLIRRLGEDRGMPQEWIDNKVAEVQGKTHLGVVNQMLQTPGNYKLAKEYFAQTKDTMRPEDAARVDDALKHATLKSETQSAATSIMSKYGNNQRAALDAARSIEDPEIQENTVREIKMRFSENDQIKRDVEEGVFADVINKITVTKEAPDSVTFASLTPSQKNHADAWLAHVRSGKQIAPNGPDYYGLRQMAAYGATRDKFLQENLLEYNTSVTQSELHELIGLQAKMREGRGDHENINDDFRTANDIINGALRQGGIDPTPKDTNSEAAKRVWEFKTEVAKQQRSLQERTGKKATNDDIQNIAENLMVKGITQKGWIWDTKKPLFEKKREETFEVGIDDVPTNEKKKIEDALRRRGSEPTDDKVLKLYTQKLEMAQK